MDFWYWITFKKMLSKISIQISLFKVDARFSICYCAPAQIWNLTDRDDFSSYVIRHSYSYIHSHSFEIVDHRLLGLLLVELYKWIHVSNKSVTVFFYYNFLVTKINNGDWYTFVDKQEYRLQSANHSATAKNINASTTKA